MKKLVIDVGGSSLKYALMNENAEIFDRGEEPTPHESLQQLLDLIEHIYQTYVEQIDGIALSLPGNIDSDTGHIYSPGALTYNMNVNIIEELHKRIPLRISLENDGKSAALAEVWKGNLKDCQDGVVLILGTGIGGGIIQHREVVKGKHFFAGEISYLMSNLEETGFHNAFALKGSTTALIMRTAKLKNVDPSTIDGKKVFEWVEENDKDALQALSEVTACLASQIYNLQCLLDPEKILIGGGISKQPRLLEGIKTKLNELYQAIPFPIPKANVDVCAYYNDSNLIGALYRFQLQFEGDHYDKEI